MDSLLSFVTEIFNNNNNKLVFNKLASYEHLSELMKGNQVGSYAPHNMTSVQANSFTEHQSNTLQLIEFNCVWLPNSNEHNLMD